MMTRRLLLGAAGLLPFGWLPARGSQPKLTVTQDRILDAVFTGELKPDCWFAGLGKSKHDLFAPENGDPIVISGAPMIVNCFNGFEFAFDWHLEPGDVVRVSREAGINGVFVMV